jgi:hypothetical protein
VLPVRALVLSGPHLIARPEPAQPFAAVRFRVPTPAWTSSQISQIRDSGKDSGKGKMVIG